MADLTDPDSATNAPTRKTEPTHSSPSGRLGRILAWTPRSRRGPVTRLVNRMHPTSAVVLLVVVSATIGAHLYAIYNGHHWLNIIAAVLEGSVVKAVLIRLDDYFPPSHHHEDTADTGDTHG